MTNMVILLSLLGVVQVRALPFLGNPCASSGYTKGMSDLIHDVSIRADDQRYGIVEGGPKVGLSPQEVIWLRSLVGEVRRTNATTKKVFQATGILYGKENQILTNSHIFFQDEGKADFNSCLFTTKTDPPIKRRIRLTKGNAKFGTENPNKDQFQDYAMAKLDKPIPGVTPLRIAKDISRIQNDSEILMLSAQMLRMQRPVGVNEPVIQKCRARKVLGPDADGGTIMYTDCSTAGGASGSIDLVRGADGVLEGVALATGGGNAEQDGQPYDYEKSNYGVSMGFDDRFGVDLDQFGSERPTQ